MADIFDEIEELEAGELEDETKPKRVLSMDPRVGVVDVEDFSTPKPAEEKPEPEGDAFDQAEEEQAGDIFDRIEYTPEFSVGRLASQTGRAVAQGAADIARGMGAIEGQRDIEAETERVRKAETGEAPSIIAALETPGMREARGRARAKYIEDMGGELHGWEREEGMRTAEDAAMARESEAQQQAWEDLADKAPEMLPGRPEGAGGFVEDVFTGVSRFAPSMAATAVAPPVGLASTSLQILGGKYKDLVDQGVDEDRAFEAAAFAALTQTPVEFASNVLQIGAIKKLFGPGSGRLVQFVKTLAKNAATEGFEEILQQPFDEIADIYAKNPDKTIEEMVQIARDNWKAIAGRTAYAGAVGAAGGALMAGGGGAIAEGARVTSDWLKKKSDARQAVEETLPPEDREKTAREILTGKPDQDTPTDDQWDMNPPPEGPQPPKPEGGPKPSGKVSGEIYPESGKTEENQGSRQGLNLPVNLTDEGEILRGESLDAEEAAAGFEEEELDAILNQEAATSPKNDLPEPTEGQKEAGNYKKAHPDKSLTRGFEITVENPAGSTRSGTSPDGKKWENTLAHHYGYFRRSEGKDGDQIDVFLSEKPNEGKVFIVDQVDPKTGKFDEHKVMMGFADESEAADAYLSNYEKGWKGLHAITRVTDEQLKEFVGSGKRQTKPFATAKESAATAKAPDETKDLTDNTGHSRPKAAPPTEAAPSAQPENPYAGKAFPHFTTPESKAALESGQPFDYSKTPIHGTGSLGAEAKTNRFAGSNRIYLSLEDETWSKTSRRVGTDQVVDVTADNANELEAKGAEFFYDYDAQAWKAKVGAKVETENLAPVSYRLAPDAKVLTIDSLEKLRAASRETGQPARDNPKFWDKLAKKYDAVALVNVRKIAKDTDSKFFQQALGDQIIVLNPDKAEVQRPEAPGGRVAPVRTTPSGETTALPATQPAAAPEAPAIETAAGDESVAGVLADPKATEAEVVEEKKKLKSQVIEGVKSGKYPVGAAVRFGTVDEIRAALKAGKLPVSEEYGEIHATPIMSQDDDVFAAYGAYDRHNMAMIIPAKYVRAKPDPHTKEVVIDEAAPLDEITFLIDGHAKEYTHQEIRRQLIEAAEKKAGAVDPEKIPSDLRIEVRDEAIPDGKRTPLARAEHRRLSKKLDKLNALLDCLGV